MKSKLENVLQKNRANFHSVVDFDRAADKLFQLDFTAANTELNDELIADTNKLSQYLNKKIAKAKAKYGIGGYNEERVLYKRSSHFNISEIVRSIHLGIDIWGAAGTRVYAPLGGMVHSFAFNNNFGDYGATIILQHQLETIQFHTLYGHLSLRDISILSEGQYFSRGDLLGHFGEPKENGDWPPHLHFQIIDDMRVNKGDYPGVCSISEKEKYLKNCPDADLILNMIS